MQVNRCQNSLSVPIHTEEISLWFRKELACERWDVVVCVLSQRRQRENNGLLAED